MKIDVTEDGIIRLKEVFSQIIIETVEGNQFPICMRDGGVEIGILETAIKHTCPGKYYTWYSVSPCGVKQLQLTWKIDNRAL